MEQFTIINERLSNIESLLLSQKTIFNFDEVAIYTGLSKSHLYKLTSTGGIPCYKPQAKHLYFNRVEIEQWLMQNRKATTSEIEEQAANYTTNKRRGVK